MATVDAKMANRDRSRSPSSQTRPALSSVFVDKREDDIVTNNSNNEEEVVTKVEEEKNDNSTSKLFTIIDDEDEEMELPSLNKNVDEVSGEVYTLK